MIKLTQITPTTNILTSAINDRAWLADVVITAAGTQVSEFSIYDLSVTTDNVTATNKVTNGVFGADTGWSKGTGWTITGGKAVHTGHGGTAGTLSQDCTETAGDIYKLVYTVAITDGGVTASLGGVTGTSRTTSGTFTEYFRASDTTNLAFTPATNGADFTIDNVYLIKLGDATNIKYTRRDALQYNTVPADLSEPILFRNGMLCVLTGASATADVYIL